MLTLNRPTFCGLTNVDSVRLNNMIRRGHVPFEVDQKTTGRGYTFFEAYLFNLMKSLTDVHLVEPVQAVDITSEFPHVLDRAWPEIGRTANLLASGNERRVIEVMVGCAMREDPLPPLPICGTDRDIAGSLRQTGDIIIGSITINASRVAANLIQRARWADVEIPSDFWVSDPIFAYRARKRFLSPRQKAQRSAEKASSD